jgi:pimeloyl-ACP methyl ester carboxylesterase
MGARYVFGLSSGALISMRTALRNPDTAKIALYEPPLEVAGAESSPLASVPLYEKAMASGNPAGAFVAVLKGIDDPSLMTRVPCFVLEPVFRWMLDKNAPDTEVPMAELIPTMHYEI